MTEGSINDFGQISDQQLSAIESKLLWKRHLRHLQWFVGTNADNAMKVNVAP
jgi:hypothetical protein